MLIFWQEWKHILRSRFFWVVLVLGAALSINTVYTNLGYMRGGDRLADDISVCYAFTEKYGTSFTEKDAEKYIKYYMTESEEGKAFVQRLEEECGVKNVTPEEIIKVYHNEPTRIGDLLQKLEEEGQSEEKDYANLIYHLELLTRPLKMAETNSLNPEQYDTKEWGKSWLEESGKNFPKWKQDLFLDGYDHLGERVEEIRKNGENHQMLPFLLTWYRNSEWFVFQFAGGSAMAILWAFSFVLAGIIAARSLGGSLMNHIPGMVYTGKTGRRLVWHKIMAVLAASGGAYIALYLLITVFYLFLFRLDLYWNVPLASMVDFDSSTIPRIAITVGGYWWFQLGVGLGAVLIMALVFSAAMVLTKSFYAGSAVSVGIALFLLLIVQMMPAMRNSLMLMSTPIGLYLNIGNFVQLQSFLFAILPHFEGLSLLIWGGFAAILAVLGFVRFRRAAL